MKSTTNLIFALTRINYNGSPKNTPMSIGDDREYSKQNFGIRLLFDPLEKYIKILHSNLKQT